jgi:elongation factor 2
MIEDGKIGPKTETKVRTKILTEQFKWVKTDAQSVWCFGSEECGPNILVNTTKGVQGLTDIKGPILSAFRWASQEGVLCGEKMRGIRFNIIDVVVHSDPAYRKDGVIQGMARKAFLGAQLAAEPRLQEPVFLCEVQAPTDVVGDIYKLMAQRRGQVVSEEPI